MTLSQAQQYASKIIEWLRPHAEPMEIAGSIRRDRPECADVDIVCIPQVIETRDMFGEVIKRDNVMAAFLENHARVPEAGATIKTSGPKQVLINLKKCQLDLWFADEKTFATRLLCRTGSMEHNIWLASRAKKLGLKWNPYEGIWTEGIWRSAMGADDVYVPREEYKPLILKQFATEAELYAALNLPFIEPKDRELPFLIKNFGQ